MSRRFLPVPLFAALLSLLAWGVHHWEPVSEDFAGSGGEAGIASVGRNPFPLSRRAELVEVMDRIVQYEHYYRSVYGHFTKLLSRIGYTVPRSLQEIYDIRIADASQERLYVTAVSEIAGRVMDMISVDQDFRITASFPLPAPRPEYLKSKAARHLRALKALPAGISQEEQGIYRGYFRYEVRDSSRTESSLGEDPGSPQPSAPVARTAFAIGIKPPVLGVQLELAGLGGSGLSETPSDTSSRVLSDLAEELSSEDTGAWVPNSGTRVGQHSGGNILETLEEVRLAQQIFRGEVGRYAKNWGELTKVTDFAFSGRDQIPDAALTLNAVLEQKGKHETLDDIAGAIRKLSSVEERQVGATLEIEPVHEPITESARSDQTQ